MKHYDENELLDLYYAGDGDAAAHVNGCDECRQRYALLRSRLEDAARRHRGEVEAKSDFFWERQRVAIRREVSKAGAPRARNSQLYRSLSIAAVFVIAFMTAALFYFRGTRVTPEVSEPVLTATASVSTSVPASVPLTVSEGAADPWESDALSGYGEVVEWESWIATSDNSGGTL